MQISKREIRMLVAIGLLAVLAAVYVLSYLPATRKVEEVMAQVDSEQQILLQMVETEEENKRLSNELSLIKGEVTSVLENLPESDDEPGLIKHLHHLFAPFGGKESIYIEDPVMLEEFSMVRVRLSYDVNYFAFKALQRMLEASGYKNRVDSFSVQMQEGDGNVAVDMALTFYFSHKE